MLFEKCIFYKSGKQMYNLAFDTTAAGCSVALFEDDKMLDSFSQSMDFGQSELLMPQIQKIIQNKKSPRA